MKQVYKTPTLKVVQFKAESGFATSGFSASVPHDEMLDFIMIFNNEGPCNDQYFFDETTTLWGGQE